MNGRICTNPPRFLACTTGCPPAVSCVDHRFSEHRFSEHRFSLLVTRFALLTSLRMWMSMYARTPGAASPESDFPACLPARCNRVPYICVYCRTSQRSVRQDDSAWNSAQIRHDFLVLAPCGAFVLSTLVVLSSVQSTAAKPTVCGRGRDCKENTGVLHETLSSNNVASLSQYPAMLLKHH